MSIALIKIKEVIIYGFFFLVLSCSTDHKETNYYTNNHNETLDIFYKKQLRECLLDVEKINTSIQKDSLLIKFKTARLSFKKLEPLMAFFNAATYKNLNRPNLPIVDEDDNAKKILNPTGFQVLEEVISENQLDSSEIEKHIENIKSTLELELKTQHFKKVKKHHILWLIKDSYLRIMALGISGFDSPIIQHSLAENKAVVSSISSILEIFKEDYSDKNIYEESQDLLLQTTEKLNHKDFNTFNRYVFIKSNLHPLLNLLNTTAKDWNVSYPFDRKLSNTANSFFNQSTFNLHQFSPNYGKVTDSVIALGKILFHEKKLSHNNKMSCASCHQPKKAFTDGLQFSIANDSSFVKRNSPTLLFSGLQAAQFYDARASSLETQIIGVVENKKEFHNNIDNIIGNLKQDTIYQNQFSENYKNGLTSVNLRHAIASYIRTLSAFNSKFDLNISNTVNNLTQDEITGFNLFMGKAKCATCHFAPTFNGTVPPNYSESELEVLGVPNTIAWKKAIIDDDKGRYNIFNVDKKKHAFKTPTIRNAFETGPYMHNGVYNSLDEVIKFYNLGGGSGIGITINNQTLPPEPLNLSELESKQLIAFIKSLSDS